MRNKMFWLFALIMIGGVGTSIFSQAEDFNFTVPVEVKNLLPEVSSVGVSCGARSLEYPSNFRGGDIGESELIWKSVPDTGNRTTTVDVKFDAKPGKDPNDAKKYTCDLRIGARPETGGTVSTIVPNLNYLFAQPKPGTVFVGQVSGDI